MHVTPERVRRERDWVVDRADRIAALINDVRSELGALFGTEVGTVTEAQVRAEVSTVFDDGDLAVNVTAMIAILRDLDVDGDYPGFVVDELLGRELAGAIAGDQPLRMLAEATFHYADAHTHGGDGDAAGLDDLDAALAAGFQTRLPGWSWREEAGPFDASSRDPTEGDE